jgi:hypothetical protein
VLFCFGCQVKKQTTIKPDIDMYNPDYIVPFRVSEKQFEQAIYKWLAEGDYTPDDILENIITGQNRIHVPMYYFKKNYQGSCSASVGYDEQEFYEEWNASSKRYERKSKWVTKWQAFSKPIQGEVEVIGSGSRTTNGNLISDICEHAKGVAWNNYDLKESKNEVAENSLSNFDLSPSASWNETAEKDAKAIIYQKTLPTLPTIKVKGFIIEVMFNDKNHFSMLLPYWVFEYEYGDNKYFAYLDGLNLNRIGGSRPEDNSRKSFVKNTKWKYWLCGIFLSITSAFLIGYYEVEKIKFVDKSWWAIGIGFILTLVLIRNKVKQIKSKSMNLRKTSLEKKLKDL